MEQNKTIFSYIGQFFATYGVMVTIFIVFTFLIGEKAKGLSSLFVLGSQGLSLITLVHHLVLAGIITFAQILFLTDKWIKSMNMLWRYILFFGIIFIVVGGFSALFKWFPVNNIKAWVAFAISFACCTGISILICKSEEKAENKKMEQALAKIKKED